MPASSTCRVPHATEPGRRNATCRPARHCGRRRAPLRPAVLAMVGMADFAREARHGARRDLGGEKPVEIDRARHGDLPARDALEAERAVIGLVADKHDRRRAGLCRGLQRDRDQLAADAEILEGRPHGKRPEQQRAAVAGRDPRHAARRRRPRRHAWRRRKARAHAGRPRGSCRRRGAKRPGPKASSLMVSISASCAGVSGR